MRVALGGRLYVRDVEAVGAGDGLGVDLASADDRNLVGPGARRLGAGEIERCIEVRRKVDGPTADIAQAGDDNVEAIRQWLADRLERTAPHDDRLAERQPPETLEIRREPPRHLSVAANDTVAGDRGD